DESIDWDFAPVQSNLDIEIDEVNIAYYRAVNLSSQPITGTATFNVTPTKAGRYFNKIECFCFSEQTLQPGESVDMPVQFFVDKDLANDPSLDDLKEITLSYTFYNMENLN
ncbi:MAG: cytochrome c oxidase assembly protein, partial [Pseudomonadota bacterium]